MRSLSPAAPPLAAGLVAVVLAGCGGTATATTTASPITPAYRARIRRLAEQRCHSLGTKALARRLHVAPAPRTAASAYARASWPPPVRAAARAGCLRGLG